MKVTLIDYTGCGHPNPERAVDLLIFTKSTRLTMHPGLLEEIERWPHDKKIAELKYMANTIPSSWEFVNYTFLVEGVSRGFTHQFVRTRTASYAQQTMRVLDVSEGPGWDYYTGPSIEHGDSGNLVEYQSIMKVIASVYRSLIHHGAKIEDARGVLPTNILTNIVMKDNMRNIVALVKKRSSSRTQGEYRDVLEAMKAEVRRVHPWIDLFIDRTADRAINDLEKMINDASVDNITRTTMIKLIDQIRAEI